MYNNKAITMTIKRKLIDVQTPQPRPGFLGAGHTARAVVQANYIQSDPFIVLMDDMLDKKDEVPVGGPHPHAGFETVSLLIEGEMGSGAHKMEAGGLQIMTAGSGVVHTETIEKKAKMRLMQLQNIPSSFSSFLYVLEGIVKAGDDNHIIDQNLVGWLDKYTENTSSELRLTAGDAGARFLLYSAQPQGDPIVSHGPFIGDSNEDISRLYSEYRQGKMKDISFFASASQ